MSTLKFDRTSKAIIINVVLEGKITIHSNLVIDTGASLLVLPWRIVTALGLKIDPTRLVQTTTVSTIESSPITSIPRLSVLDKVVINVDCLVKDLPPESGVDGLLGLSFLRNFQLSIDFKKGSLLLE